MPKGKNALLLLMFSMVSFAVMTASPAPSSPAEGGFNVSLMDRQGKSTLRAFNGLQKVVIDAGHGGKDPGGMGANSREKHIALSIARLLTIGIRTNFPDVEVIMTRTDDTFIPLYERAAIANDAGADLFISIHANIMPGGTSTYGTETFVMGQHVASHNLAVAKRENASILLEDNVEKNYGYDPNSDEGHIMMSMFQHAFLERSIHFAELVENEFAAAGRKSRGVKQAGFVVLKETTMPAVLVETGFMSNPDEEAFLLSDGGQRRLADALLRAFGKYYAKVTGKRSAAPPVATTPTEAAGPTPVATSERSPTPARDIQTDAAGLSGKASVFGKEIDLGEPPLAERRKQWTAKGVGPSPITYQTENTYVPPVATRPRGYTPPVATAPPATSPRPYAGGPLGRQVNNATVAPPNRVIPGGNVRPPQYGTPVVPPVDSITPGKVYVFGEAKRRKAPPAPRGPDLKTIPDEQLLYAVQVIATKKELNLEEPRWQRIPFPLVKITEGGLNKYQARGLASAAQAKAAKERIQSIGFYDALIVVYLAGKRLDPAAVRYLLER